MSHVDYSRQGCKHFLFCSDGPLAAMCGLLHMLFICECEREKTEEGKREGKQINVSALYLNRLLSLSGECQVGSPY